MLAKSALEGHVQARRTRKWVEVSDAYLAILHAQPCRVVHGAMFAETQCTVQEFLTNHECSMLPLVVAAPMAITPTLLQGSCKLFALAPQLLPKKKHQQRVHVAQEGWASRSAIHRLFASCGRELRRVSVADPDGSESEPDREQAVQPWTLEQGSAIVDSLRRWAPKIVEGLTAEDADAEKVLLEGSIAWIEAMAKGWQPPQQQGRHHGYSDVQMLRWWSLSGTVKNFSQLKATLHRCALSMFVSFGAVLIETTQRHQTPVTPPGPTSSKQSLTNPKKQSGRLLELKKKKQVKRQDCQSLMLSVSV